MDAPALQPSSGLYTSDCGSAAIEGCGLAAEVSNSTLPGKTITLYTKCKTMVTAQAGAGGPFNDAELQHPAQDDEKLWCPTVPQYDLLLRSVRFLFKRMSSSSEIVFDTISHASVAQDRTLVQNDEFISGWFSY